MIRKLYPTMVKKKGTKRFNSKKAVVEKQKPITDYTTSEVTVPAFGALHQPVFMKVCRLCEAKDGPFLNIFDADKITYKKIEAVMPFRIEENDDLPHKICFRCSAKLEELYEFIQKCIRTQDRLQTVLGKKGPFLKGKHRELWEEKLNKSNISNDDICAALIKKAMEGIKDIPINPALLNDDSFLKKNPQTTFKVNEDECRGSEDDPQTNESNKIKTNDKKKSSFKETKKEDPNIINNKSNNDTVETSITRSLRSCSDIQPVGSESNITKSKETNKPDKKAKNSFKIEEEKNTTEKEVLKTNTFSLNDTTPEPEPIFNIMDHISTIKVNGVGMLFQCRLCNKNFLKKQVVMSHACARNGGLKVEGPKLDIQPKPPKISTVKYINTKQAEVKKTREEVKKPAANDKPIELDDDNAPLVKKPKPRIGPASKVRRNNEADDSASSTPTKITVVPFMSTNVSEPVIQFPNLPSLNSRYKLMAGPNNTYTLVEEKLDNFSETQPQLQQDVEKKKYMKVLPKPLETPATEMAQSENRPYPVGLFKTVPHNSSVAGPLHSEPVSFTTPAMKKQSYTVVQTGNPSKLLISSKPQTADEVPKKRLRRTKNETKKDESNKQPFSVTLEDTAPPRDAEFFTFINVDPLLQPSYVLPTDNIIQESQISTSTNVSKQTLETDSEFKYTCNMCNEKFTREKKLLTHIQSHYSKMDEEDQVRTEKTGRKRRR